jgi:hypothetical protein
LKGESEFHSHQPNQFGQPTATDRNPPPEPQQPQTTAPTAGMVPLILLGRCSTPVPFRCRLTVVVGPPLALPQSDSPSEALVQKYLDIYISEMRRIFEQHKAAAGHKDLVLRVL